jgi:ribosome-associated protein
MLRVNAQVSIPDEEFQWTYVRAGGPGGQNVNKVASKAVLRWHLASSPSLPEDIKARLRAKHLRRITTNGEIVLSSQRYRDQERNRQDCLEKLRGWILEAAVAPRPRRPTRPTRGSRETRLREKRRRSATKTIRRQPADE